MRTDRVRTAFAVAAFAMALAPSSAAAFCRTRTVPIPAEFEPSTSGGCFTQGAPLYHLSQCVPYRLAAETPALPRAALSTALARAFGAWTSVNPACFPGISAVELAPTDEKPIAGYTTGTRGRNLIGVVPGAWPHAGGGETLSLATLTFDATTGEIFDADLEINSEISFSTSEVPPANGYDLTAVLTHEAGHFLGLAHSAVPEAVMWPSYAPGSIRQRTLVSDDQLGICAIYPNRTTRVRESDSVAATACDLSAGAPGTTTCGDPAITNGCAIGAVPAHNATSSPPWAWLAVLGAVGIAWRARSRSRASRA